MSTKQSLALRTQLSSLRLRATESSCFPLPSEEVAEGGRTWKKAKAKSESRPRAIGSAVSSLFKTGLVTFPATALGKLGPPATGPFSPLFWLGGTLILRSLLEDLGKVPR